MAPTRDNRFHDVRPRKDSEPNDDIRSPARRDRDRILYSSAFRRLADVTQVVSPSEGQVFHNRLTHTLKVAQVGRSIAETLIARVPPEARSSLSDLDADVVEAAALAHDLGHPPFGHIAEETLNDLLKDARYSVVDGFEGNAQSFRIITRSAVHNREYEGLNLTGATLNAVLKYPNLRGADGRASQKWGAYRTEEPVFRWARSGLGDGPTLEAQIMDWADDVAYSVHDAEDFYRAGLIPLDKIGSITERRNFVTKALDRLRNRGEVNGYTERDLIDAFNRVADIIPVDEPYVGTRKQRARLRGWTSDLIGSYVSAAQLQGGIAGQRGLSIDARYRMEVLMLKQLIWIYVIDNPSLATRQYAQQQVISKLFDIYMDAASSSSGRRRAMFPHGYRERIEEADGGDPQERTRVVVDFIASMTEQQALGRFQHLCGIALTSALQPLMTS